MLNKFARWLGGRSIKIALGFNIEWRQKSTKDKRFASVDGRENIDRCERIAEDSAEHKEIETRE